MACPGLNSSECSSTCLWVWLCWAPGTEESWDWTTAETPLCQTLFVQELVMVPRWRVHVSKLQAQLRLRERITEEKRRTDRSKCIVQRKFDLVTITKFRDISPPSNMSWKSRWQKKRMSVGRQPHVGQFYCIKHQPAALWSVIYFRKRPLRARYGTF